MLKNASAKNDSTKFGKVNWFEKGDSDRYFGGIFLIFIGLILFLNTTGILMWSVWLVLIRFWPLFIVFAGLQIIFDKNKWATLFVTAFMSLSLVIVVGMAVVATGLNYQGRNLIPSGWYDKVTVLLKTDNGDRKNMVTTVTKEEFPGIEEVILDIDMTASSFDIDSDESGNILQLDSWYYESVGEPDLKNVKDGKNLNINFRQRSKALYLNFNKDLEYHFTLGKLQVPLSLDLNAGTASGRINLANQQVRNMAIEAGVGQADIIFDKESVPSGESKIEVGAGDVVLNIPRDVGYKINLEVGVGKAQIANEEFSDIGMEQEIRSENYKTADKVMELNVEVGVGKFTLNYL